MDADGPAHELAVLFPAPRSVVIKDRTIEIKRCGIAQAGRIIDAGGGLYARMQADDGPEFLELFEQFPAETTALIVAATGLDTEWVAALDPIEQFTLASAWMEVNAAFFVQRLLPPLARYLTAVRGMWTNGAGATSSTPSTSTATATPESTPPKPLDATSKPLTAPINESAVSA